MEELWFEGLWRDARYGARMLLRSPGFTVVAMVTLGLGIGANTALFSVVNGVLLRPLPFARPNQLVSLYERRAAFLYASISYPNFDDWRRDNQSFETIAAFRDDDFSLTGLGQPERISGVMVSADFFQTLGVQPILGRHLDAAQDKPGGMPEVLISEAFWKKKLSGARDAPGRALTLNGTDYTIVGVVPASFKLRMQNFDAGDVYIPIGQWNDVIFHQRNAGEGMNAVARLKPGISLDQARADMDRVAANLAKVYPEDDTNVGATVVSLKEKIVGDVRPYLLVLLAAVFLVLAIACVNVANLMLARSMARSREFAIRAALGASKVPIVRQLLTESVLLSLCGGGLGLILAAWGTPFVLGILGAAVPRLEEIRLDARVLFFTLLVSIAAGILFGMAPALRSLQSNLQKTLRERARGASSARSRAQGAFVIMEMAMAMVLLIGAGLMTRSLARLWSVDPGFDARRVLFFNVALPPAMEHASPDAIHAELRRIHDEIGSVPGVSAVSLQRGSLPMMGDSDDPFWIAGRPKPARESEMDWALWYEVEPDYLKAMGIPLLRGRFFTPADNQHSRSVIVIDESFAQKYFPGQDPIGRSIQDEFTDKPAEIVGVVGHVKQWGLDDSTDLHAEFYIPFLQIPARFVSRAAGSSSVLVRTEASPLTLLEPIRRVIQGSNSEEVVFEAHAYDEIVSRSLAQRSFSITLLALFAALALVLSSIGIYGVVSYVVGQRTQEIGVRLALGAQRRDVLKLVLGAGARTALLGVAIGLAAALGLTQLISSLLYGVTATDPLTFVVVPLALTLVALAACYIPARRAMRVDPVIALRYE